MIANYTPEQKKRIYGLIFASVYPMYIQKAEKKGRTKAEVDEIISWLTGYDKKGLQEQIDKKNDFELSLYLLMLFSLRTMIG